MIRIVFVFVLALLIFHLAADCLARRLTGRQHGANGCGLYLPASRLGLGLGPELCQRLPAAFACLAAHPPAPCIPARISCPNWTRTCRHPRSRAVGRYPFRPPTQSSHSLVRLYQSSLDCIGLGSDSNSS